ncbi:hypothetical protein OPV22_011034 [Ensete ventricosum]|uniref:Uncharacterized protein n=1 Tax=Ensete ventricosum TaxID=4639 RepID=A0AAV8RGY3_ENSVE|nr:hypothetical protein OPV22_011034 [Ensete ventricosum]
MVVNNRSSRWFIDFRDRPVHVNRTPFLSRKVSLLFFPFGEGLLHPWIDGDCPELAAKVLNLTSRPRLLLAAVGVGFLDGRHFVAVRRRSRHRCCFALKRRQEISDGEATMEKRQSEPDFSRWKGSKYKVVMQHKPVF